MSAATRLHLIPGTTFRRRITWRADGLNVDLTGSSATFSAMDRDGVSLIALSVGSGITIGGAAGTIDLHLAASASADFIGDGTYRLHITEAGGDERDLLAGVIDFAPASSGPFSEGDLIIDERDGDLIILESAGQGPAGINGGTTITMTAAGAIGGHRLVIGDASGLASYADQSEPSHYGRVVGLSTGAASDGDPVSVQLQGDITEPSWTWTPGLIWAGSNGLLTQAPPTTGWIQQVASALTATRIVLDLKQPILLS